jgi:hypothetical protein
VGGHRDETSDQLGAIGAEGLDQLRADRPLDQGVDLGGMDLLRRG